MNWIGKIQSEPKQQKIRTLWMAIAVCAVILTGLWILIGNYNPPVKPDTSLFSAFKKGITDLKTIKWKQ